MAASFDGTTSRYLEIADSSLLDLPSGGWTIYGMFYPVSPLNTFSYIYSQGQPLSNLHAINVMLTSSSSTLRLIVDVPAGTLVDFNSSNTIVFNQWNGFAVCYDPPTVRMFLNGTQTTSSPPALGTVTPASNAFIGQATAGGARQFNGRICHLSQLNRSLTADEGLKYTDPNILISPEFAQNSKVWHIEAWNSSFFGDVQNQLSVSEVGGMVYGPHAPAAYQSMTATNLDEEEPVEGGGAQVQYVRA